MADSDKAALRVPKAPAEEPTDQRQLQLPTFLRRFLPFFGNPAWTDATRWRAFVKGQPIATICRDTLISNVADLEWDIVPRSSEDMGRPEITKAIEYYKDLFTHLEGDFDTYVDLLLQDMLDLPFGGAVEVGREDDDPDKPVLWADHLDAATLYPTGNTDFPVAQQVPDIPSQVVYFPKHAVERVFLSPRPEIRLEGWGLAPPQKAYLAIEMLFRGDHYYWKLLLDTPEAGILDLGDMDEAAATQWLDGFRELFQGIDGFKIPVLYGHEKPAVWIPLNRPPVDMLYDKQYLKYAQVVAAAYGLRLSDIGLAELEGEKTLAGVIRGERQSKRTGRALVRSKTENHFNSLLPKALRFVWKDRDEEGIVARGKALLGLAQGLTVAKEAGVLDQAEARAELVASGVLYTEIDPRKLPAVEKPALPGQPGGGGSPIAGLLGNFGKLVRPGGEGGAPKNPLEALGGGVPPSQGGRGEAQPLTPRSVEGEGAPPPMTEEQDGRDVLMEQLNAIIQPGLRSLETKAEDIRLRRLIRAATRMMFERVQAVSRTLTDEQIEHDWLPAMHMMTFDLDGAPEDPVVRAEEDELLKEIQKHLSDDVWWVLGLSRKSIVDILRRGFMAGLIAEAQAILRTLYEEGLSSSPALAAGLRWNITNKAVLDLIEGRGADLVQRVDDGTKYYISRFISSGVRQGLSSPEIAQAMREGGARADDILANDDWMADVQGLVREGLRDMSVYRSNSIVNTEIAWAENAGHLEQLRKTGLTKKAWKHYGERGVTEAGNVHPCIICEGNENLGWVPMDYLFPTVFKDEPAPHPPGHPGVCHCSVIFNKEELFEKVKGREYKPWTGGR